MSRAVRFEFETLLYDELVNTEPKPASLPRRPGVFRIFDVHDRLILLEKTHDLAQRIPRFYTDSLESRDSKALDLREITSRVEFCSTDSPMETLYVLYRERRHWFPQTYWKMGTFPRYYLLKINRRQRFPRLYAARQIKSGVAYFGPFTRRSELNRIAATLERTFRIRPCGYNIREGVPYPECLYFQMQTCSKPCNSEIGRPAYLRDIDDAIRFVEGREHETVSRTLDEINQLSEQMLFEEAGRLRKKLDRISRARKEHRQNYFDIWRFDYMAVMASSTVKKRKVALIRQGRFVAFEEHDVDGIEDSLGALIRAHPAGATLADGTEHRYDEFCLVSKFLIRPTASVKLFVLRSPEATASEIAGEIQKETAARHRGRNQTPGAKGASER